MSNAYSAISFSNVAPRYNQINELPAQAATEIGIALASMIASAAPVLDAGCGAGRIAIPAAEAGLSMVGLDRNEAMLNEAVRLAGQRSFWGVHGDVACLPFTAESFNAVLSINVLHLVPAWEQAIAEVVRVLRPGGLFIQARGWMDPESCASQIRDHMRTVIMELNPGLRPTAAASPAVLAKALAELGGVTEDDQIVTRWQVETSPAEILAQMAARQHNQTWMLDDELLTPLVDRMNDWIHVTWSNPAAVQSVDHGFILTVTRELK
jgi:ubiquinone/menaquinone biosynthesis C-methylase UbiE